MKEQTADEFSTVKQSCKSKSLPFSNRRHHKVNENITTQGDCASDDSGYLSMHEIHACLHQQSQDSMLSIKCPVCALSFVLDDRGVHCLPNNIILESLVELYKCKNSDIDCQLCETEPANNAVTMCEQCRVSYCETCLKIYHPKRGPFASHTLSQPNNNKCVLKHRGGVLKCFEHEEENISMYCVLCKMPVCYLCFEEGRHCGHEARALGTMYKEQKVNCVVIFFMITVTFFNTFLEIHFYRSLHLLFHVFLRILQLSLSSWK